jgi:hypothetical protein
MNVAFGKNVVVITPQCSKESRFFVIKRTRIPVAYIETDLNCWKKVSITVVGLRNKLRRLSTVGSHDF